ncbi:hypothetical protein ACXIZN_11745 [Amycolatopsis sp. TRM77291]
MNAPSQRLTAQERKARRERQTARVDELRRQLAEAEDELRAIVADDRRAGVLTKDLIADTGWSHDTIATILKRAGVVGGKNAPRKPPADS